MDRVTNAPDRLGNLTRSQTDRAGNFTSQVARFVTNRATGGKSVTDLQPSTIYGCEAQRVIEIQRGDLTFEVTINVKRNDGVSK